ncbi:MAG: hypothetical protein HYU30_06980 [Chloroflexi bacterium]|nr:hypothetical protein [Chloroflexota bacterium]
MQEELRDLGQETGCRIAESLFYPVRTSRDRETALYRIFHEALINVRRHAQATEVRVALQGDHAAVRLEVADNGTGFDVLQALGRKRVGGLMTMQRRAALAGGCYFIESAPGQGTTVKVDMPLAVH